MTEQQFTTEEIQNEQWRDVPNFEGVYSASNLGRIRNDLAREGTYKGRIRKISRVDKRHYPNIVLSYGGNKVQYPVHRLIALIFIGECPDGCEVNHKDGNKANNRASNLEYLTRKEHYQHTKENGLLPSPDITRHIGASNGRAKLSDNDIIKIRTMNGTHTDIAKMYGVHLSTIARIRNNKRWQHI